MHDCHTGHSGRSGSFAGDLKALLTASTSGMASLRGFRNPRRCCAWMGSTERLRGQPAVIKAQLAGSKGVS